MVLEKTLGSPLDFKEIKLVNPKGSQPWIFFGRIDAEAEVEAPILWPPDVKSQLIRKDPDYGKDWRQEEKGTVEDEVVWWHHQLNGYEFEPDPGDGEKQGSLAMLQSMGSQRVGHDLMTEQQQPSTPGHGTQQLRKLVKVLWIHCSNLEQQGDFDIHQQSLLRPHPHPQLWRNPGGGEIKRGLGFHIATVGDWESSVATAFSPYKSLFFKAVKSPLRIQEEWQEKCVNNVGP